MTTLLKGIRIVAKSGSLFLGSIAVILAGCSDRDIPTEPAARSSAKAMTASIFEGKDEAGHAEIVGSRDAAEFHLRSISARLAVSLNDPRTRESIFSLASRDGGVALSTLLNSTAIGANLTDGYVSQTSSSQIGGRLSIEIGKLDNASAVRLVSEALFGLRVRALGGVATDAVPVFYNPTTDESDTEHYFGFGPDGSEVSVAFGQEDFPYPALYLYQDEGYFEDKPFLGLLTPAVKPAPSESFQSFMENAFRFPLITAAHASAPHTCYEYKELQLNTIRIYDDHEGTGSPEIRIKARIVYHPTGSWGYSNVGLTDVDDVDSTYNYSSFPKKIFDWSGEKCLSDAVYYPNLPYPRDDWSNFVVWEEDMWPNPDDDVAKWVDVPMSTGSLLLDEDSPYSDTSHPEDARINVASWF